ncbi:turripeptide Pal9.2-like [Atheta coriaria]|uniref:turripeptide Pal9.2-like n=1 Tax=Dalotia coriaria TaxID=877792 RepID=UPI0031F4558B
MKSILLICAIGLLAFASASPAKGSTKAALKAKPCLKPCPESYIPVCGGDDVAKPITFGNECVLTNYNCEQDKQFKILSQGECPGGASVRLS